MGGELSRPIPAKNVKGGRGSGKVKRPRLRTLRVCFFVAAIVAVPPVGAGGGHGKASFQRNHLPTSHHGVAIFRRGNNGLRNGVTIFRRSAHASHGSAKKSGKRKHAGAKGRGGHKGKKHRAKSRKHKHVALDHVRPKRKARSKKKHDRKRKKKDVVYVSGVYATPARNEVRDPHDREEADCRHLTERGYDLSGRRVLVEWTLCFDEQGEAFVPEDGRRIVARF